MDETRLLAVLPRDAVMAEQNSFLKNLDRLQAGDNAAAAEVVRRYHHRLLALARSRLARGLQPKLDPEDVVQSVYKSFFHRQALGQFELASWDNLWTLLTLLTIRKCASRAEYFQAACRSVECEAAPAPQSSSPSWEPAAAGPTPEEEAMLAETLDVLLGGLEPWEREIVTLSLQGYLVAEISARTGRAERTVERVRGRVRRQLLRLLQKEANQEN